jgi:hypothetical protein
MRRHIIAALAILTFLGAMGFWIWPPSPGCEQYKSACWHLWPVLVVLWLAYPDVQRIPTWGLVLVPVLLIVFIKWPKLLLLAIPALLLLAILRRPLRPQR